MTLNAERGPTIVLTSHDVADTALVSIREALDIVLRSCSVADLSSALHQRCDLAVMTGERPITHIDHDRNALIQ